MTKSLLDVDKLQAPMRATHASGINKTYDWRLSRLKELLAMIEENQEAIREALCLDLGRDPHEALLLETKPLVPEIEFAMRNLKSWMRPKSVGSAIVMFPGFSYIDQKPLASPGVLVIGPYNYPIHLVVRPLIGILAGGNPAVIKPSELCPRSGALLDKLVSRYFEPGAVQVVLGEIPETTALLEKPWGKVVFTGSGRVGSIVAQACAKTLTPTLLELGGKCPFVIDETVSPGGLEGVASRLVFAKFLNAGQTCIAPDTLIIHEKHVKEFSKHLVNAIERQFGKDQKKGEIARIVNTRNTRRIMDMLREAERAPETKVIYGGSALCDVDTRYVNPTVVLNPPKDSKMLHEEVFGPVLPMITVASREEAIQRIHDFPGTPLQLYVFTPKRKVFDEYTSQCETAGAFQNDGIVHMANLDLPFGGLGSSGHGQYGGKFSFEAFSHKFPRAHRPIGAFWDLKELRCHPYSGFKGVFMENWLFALPSVPVLHVRRLFMAGLGVILLSQVPQGVRDVLADILEMAVGALRE